MEGDNGGRKGLDMVRVSRSIYRMRAAFLAQLFWPSSNCGQLQKAQLVRGRELRGPSPRPARLEGSPVALPVATGPGSAREPSRPGAPDARRFFSTSGSTACLPYPSLVGAAVEAGRGRNIFLGKP